MASHVERLKVVVRSRFSAQVLRLHPHDKS